MWSSLLAVRLAEGSEVPAGLALLLATRLEGSALVGCPESASPAEREEDSPMLQPASSRDTSAGTRTRYI
jgi:hypothetical protein